MQITIELPEDIAEGLESKWNDLARAALESLALEAYQSHALTAAPGFRDADRVDAFLKKHEIFDYSATGFGQDRETLRELRIERLGPEIGLSMLVRHRQQPRSDRANRGVQLGKRLSIHNKEHCVVDLFLAIEFSQFSF